MSLPTPNNLGHFSFQGSHFETRGSAEKKPIPIFGGFPLCLCPRPQLALILV